MLEFLDREEAAGVQVLVTDWRVIRGESRQPYACERGARLHFIAANHRDLDTIPPRGRTGRRHPTT